MAKCEISESKVGIVIFGHRSWNIEDYLTDTLNENLLGLLSCGIGHLKLLSEIAKHPHTDAICVTANELARTKGNTVWLIHKQKVR